MEEVFKNKWLSKRYLYPSIVYATKSIPFYKKWDGLDIFTIYNKLPPIGKTEILTESGNFINDDLITSKTLFSSGFQSGIKTPILKSKKEVDFLNLYFKDVEKEDVLNLYLGYYASGDYMIELNNIHIVNLLNDIDLPREFFIKIQSKANGRRIRIFGLESQLRLFTLALKVSKIKLDIVEVISGGDLITSRLKEFYQKNLTAKLENRFGITEIFGGAKKEAKCDLFHFDEFVLFDLYKDYHFGNQIIGELMLSSSYPFNQKFFLLKYLTGDIVSMIFCEKCNSIGFRHLGRKKNLLFNEDKLIFSTSELYDALDCFSEISKSALFKNNKFLINPKELGHLRFNYVKNGFEIGLKIVVSELDTIDKVELKTRILNKITPLMYQEQFKFLIDFESESSSIMGFMPDEIEL